MRIKGFTLVELIVSVGILGIMVTISGTVFSLTLDSTGQANALMDVTNSIKSFERQLRAELANVSPNESIMIIDPHVVNAWWDADTKELYRGTHSPYNAPVEGHTERLGELTSITTDALGKETHHFEFSNEPEMPSADVLTFFTATPGNSLSTGDHSALQMVTYGHADIGKTNRNTGAILASNPFYTSNSYLEAIDEIHLPDRVDETTVFPIPANQWHLARKAIMVSTSLISDPDTNLRASRDDLFTGDWDILSPTGQATQDAQGYFNIPGFVYSRDVVNRLYPPIDADWGNGVETAEYTNGRWWKRALLDPEPPATYSNRAASYFLPNCASFKVEWTFESSVFNHLKETIWFRSAIRFNHNGSARFADIEIPLFQAKNALRVLDPDHPDINNMNGIMAYLSYRLNSLTDDYYRGYEPVFQGDDCLRDGVAIFYPKIPSQEADKPPIKDPIYPSALRITLEVYDQSGRLDKPIRHTMVLPVGS